MQDDNDTQTIDFHNNENLLHLIGNKTHKKKMWFIQIVLEHQKLYVSKMKARAINHNRERYGELLKHYNLSTNSVSRNLLLFW